MKTNREKISACVREFFHPGGIKTVKYVYATPGTPNHSANFYGDTYICRLCQRDVVGCIECAAEGWNWEDDQDATDSAIDVILDDLQYNRPKNA